MIITLSEKGYYIVLWPNAYCSFQVLMSNFNNVSSLVHTDIYQTSLFLEKPWEALQAWSAHRDFRLIFFSKDLMLGYQDIITASNIISAYVFTVNGAPSSLTTSPTVSSSDKSDIMFQNWELDNNSIFMKCHLNLQNHVKRICHFKTSNYSQSM